MTAVTNLYIAPRKACCCMVVKTLSISLCLVENSPFYVMPNMQMLLVTVFFYYYNCCS